MSSSVDVPVARVHGTVEDGAVVADNAYVHPGARIRRGSLVCDDAVIHGGAIVESWCYVGGTGAIHAGAILEEGSVVISPFGFISGHFGEYPWSGATYWDVRREEWCVKVRIACKAMCRPSWDVDDAIPKHALELAGGGKEYQRYWQNVCESILSLVDDYIKIPKEPFEVPERWQELM